MYLLYPAQVVVDANSSHNCDHQSPEAKRSFERSSECPSSVQSIRRNTSNLSISSHESLCRGSVTPIEPEYQPIDIPGPPNPIIMATSAPPYQTTTILLDSNINVLPTFKDLTRPSFKSLLDSQKNITYKLIKTVADFTQQLSSIHDHHAEALQVLVENFRIRNAELRRERPSYQSSMFSSWEVLLQEIEADSQVHGDIARSIGRQVSTPLLEKTFHRKVQSRKVFIHRESFETILKKAEEMLDKCYKEYGEAYKALLENRNHTHLGAYYDSHNRYVQQLHATNGMIDEYYKRILPNLMQELEDVYINLSESVAMAISGAAEILRVKSEEQVARYEMIETTGKNVNCKGDMSSYIKHLNLDVKALSSSSENHRRGYAPPQVDITAVVDSPEQTYVLKDEVVLDRLAEIQVPSKPDSLKQEVSSLEQQIKQLNEALDCLARLQQRSLDSSLFNKANELEEDISLKKFDLRVAQIHLAAVSNQLELFKSKLGNKSEETTTIRERKMSSSSSSGTGSIKNKWMRAFRSLKAGHSTMNNGNSGDVPERKTSKSGPATLPDYQHIFQEYTYKRITACDYCREVLRGHVRQGLKCKLCKMNVHSDCLEKVPKCQPKPKLLRRQKSASEIDAKIVTEIDEEKQNKVASSASADVRSSPLANEIEELPKNGSKDSDQSSYLEPQDVDPIYQLLKQAVDLGGSRRDRDGAVCSGGGSSSSSLSSLNRRVRPNNSNHPPTTLSTMHGTTPAGPRSMLTVVQPSNRSSTSAPHSPQRHKLSLRMKSLSLDSPESNERVLRRQHHHHHHQPDHQQYTSSHNSSYCQSPQSPVHNRRLLSTTAIKGPLRMSSVDLPDDTEKSLSSASTSPCPSPKPHRLLPANLYVVLYNFKGRHQDELDLRAGYKITVIDTSDPDWWKGKCLGKLGFFPSKYVTKLHPGERALQVTHNIEVRDGSNGLKLLRDQIVIQIGEESEGMVKVRAGDKQVSCPLNYLVEV